MKFHFKEEVLTEIRMQCAHQQSVRDSPELCNGLETTALKCVETTPTGHSQKKIRNPVQSLWLESAGTSSEDALRETKATRRQKHRQVLG